MKNLQSLSSSTSSNVHAIGEVCLPAVTKDALFRAVESNNAENLSELFAECTVDLTAVDVDGATALHRAVALGHDAITKILIEKANSDPKVLNAVDRETYTPLMRAAEMRSVPMMLALIAAGGRTDEHVNLYNKFVRESDRGDHTAAARMLIEAKGDISAAFESAVWSRNPFAARLFLEAGADTIPALRACVKASDWDKMRWMIANNHIHGQEVLLVLAEARLFGNKDVMAKLTAPYVAVGTLRAMKGQSDWNMAYAMKSFTEAFRQVAGDSAANHYASNLLRGVVRGAAMLEHQYWDRELESISALIAAGAPVAPMFSWLIEHDEPELQQKIIDFVSKVHAVSVAKQLREANDENLREFGDRVVYAAAKSQPPVGATRIKKKMFSMA